MPTDLTHQQEQDRRALPLSVCGAPMRGAPSAGTIYVEQHADGSLIVEGVWHATVSRCVPVGMLIISLREIEGVYWCFESDFVALGFTVPAPSQSTQPR